MITITPSQANLLVVIIMSFHFLISFFGNIPRSGQRELSPLFQKIIDSRLTGAGLKKINYLITLLKIMQKDIPTFKPPVNRNISDLIRTISRCPQKLVKINRHFYEYLFLA